MPTMRTKPPTGIGADAVLGVADLRLRPKAGRGRRTGGPHAAAGGGEVAELVDEDQREDPDEGRQDTQTGTHADRIRASARRPRSRQRAPARESLERGSRARLERVLDDLGDLQEPVRPSRNAATATSLAALRTQGAPPAAGLAGERRQRKVSRSGGSNASARREVQPRRRPAAGARVASAQAIGTRMSGQPRWASSEPSRWRTSAWTMLRVHDDLDALVRQVEEHHWPRSARGPCS